MSNVKKFPSKIAYEIKIQLLDIKPPIWRKILVDSNITLPKLHLVIQGSMGWTDTHLHQFIIGREIYCEPSDDVFYDFTDYRKVKLNDVLRKPKDKIIYEYDFGDGWQHSVVLEKILDETVIKVPICLGGKRNCPPEDCGGPPGYEDLLKIISDPKHKEYYDMMDWLGDDFDPEYFDTEEVNEILKA
ncbi:MAG: plasmid pRiA4b ORF-3 family protein [Leptospira sp.]|nr:plasmid pRiA4b ORF-3 family protein [Leptospira sp.]